MNWITNSARDELVEVVRVLEQGGLDLDASLRLWERGEELAARCGEHLAGARARIEAALAAAETDGGLTASHGPSIVEESFGVVEGVGAAALG